MLSSEVFERYNVMMGYRKNHLPGFFSDNERYDIEKKHDGMRKFYNTEKQDKPHTRIYRVEEDGSRVRVI